MLSAAFLAGLASGADTQKALLPPDVVERANSYIRTLVGDQYFARNYRFLPEESSVVSPGEFSVRYAYVPLRALGDPDHSIRIVVRPHSGTPVQGTVAMFDGTSIVEPRVHRQEAIEIALKAYGKPPPLHEVRASLRLPNKKPRRWRWKVEIEEPDPDPLCGRRRVFHVSVADGSLLNSLGEMNEACQ